MSTGVMTTNARRITEAGRSTDFFGRFAGAMSSRGTSTAKSAPHASAIPPGTMKAMRQPAYLTRKPVKRAAKAMPRLPARPLTPMVKPGFFAFCTIMGMPTGW